jgi:GNAT superfamily N-acetyltransferase
MAIEISSERDRIDLKQVVSFLRRESYWAKGRSAKSISKSLANSLCFSIHEDGRFAGLARVVTDYSTVYYLCDVFILPEYRGKGLGKKIIQHVVKDSRLRGFMGMLLTRDAHGLYSRHGFTGQEKERKMFMIKRGRI